MENQGDIIPQENGIELPEVVWTPGNEAEPMGEEELQELMSHLPSNSVLHDLSAKPGKGLGRNNLKALINSGKPFLLNGMDADLRADLEEVMQIKLEEENQPYLVVIPTKVRNDINFHFIEAVAPIYENLEGDAFPEKRRKFLLDFLEMADKEDRRVKGKALAKGKGKDNEGERMLNEDAEATPTRSYTHTSGPYRWYQDQTLLEQAFRWPLVPIATYWETRYIDYYKMTNGRNDIQVVHEGNWDSNYFRDDRNGKRGWANGHSTLKVVPPSGYSISDYAPKNINGVTNVSETTGFELSGTAECSSSDCSAGIGASYSESKTLSYSIKDWEILSNGYGQWDFKQASPFKAYKSPMYTDFACYWEGGCLYYPPALSRGTFNHKAAVLLTSGGGTGWQKINFKNTGRPFMYSDDGWFASSWQWYTFTRNSVSSVYIG